MTTLWLIAGVLASVIVHEGAHMLVAKQLGWEIQGIRVTRRLIGVQVKTEDKLVASSAWMVAIAGPMSNVMFGDALMMLHNPIATFLGYFNFAVAIINLLPIPGSDGTIILKGLRDELES